VAATVLALAQISADPVDLHEALRRICKELARATGAESAGGYIRGEGGELRRAAAYHMPRSVRELVATTPVPLEEQSFARTVFEDGHPLWSDDVRSDPRCASPLFRRFPHQAGLMLPLRFRGEVRAAVYLIWWTERRRFDEAELDLLRALSHQAGTLLSHVALSQEMATRAERLRALGHLTRQVSASLDLDAVLSQVAGAAVALLDVPLAGVWVVDDTGEALELKTLVGTRGPVSPGRQIKRRPLDDRSVVGWVATHGRPLDVPDVLADDRVVDLDLIRKAQFASLHCAPVAVEGVLLGVVTLYDRKPIRLKGDDADLLLGLIGHAAVAVRNVRLYAREQAARARAEQALAALQESEARHLALVEGSPVGIYIHQDGVIQFANRALAEMHGYASAGELVDRPYGIVLPPEEHPRMEQWRQAQLAGAPTPSRYEFENLRRDGTRFWVENWAAVVTWGGAPAIVVTFVDITERKRAEDALHRSDTMLRQSQKMDALGRLAGGVAHDFNNLLAVMLGYSERLRELASSTEMARASDSISGAARRGAALTRQLLAFSRKQVLTPRVLDLNAVVTGFEKLLRRLIGEDVDLLTRLAPDLGRTQADPGQIEQVLMNLAVNARDAMPRGGRLELATANAQLDAAAAAAIADAAPGRYVTLTIRDTGTGMTPETQARLFEPFFTTKEPGRGTGLGLATVYGIVRQSDGFIHVESAPDRGATFVIHLPRVDALVDSIVATPSPPRLGGPETVLLVEDADDVRALLRAVLERAGYAVLDAKGGQGALLLFSHHPVPIDLLLTDVVMPGISGVELAEQLGRAHAGLRVVLMSGYMDDALERHGVTLATTPVLQKPFSLAELLAAVRTALDHAPGGGE
jgi:PAS domain S-box-containing protein